MRLSLTKAAQVAMSSAARQEIRVRSVEKHFQERSEGTAGPSTTLRFGRDDNSSESYSIRGWWKELQIPRLRDDKGEGGVPIWDRLPTEFAAPTARRGRWDDKF